MNEATAPGYSGPLCAQVCCCVLDTCAKPERWQRGGPFFQPSPSRLNMPPWVSQPTPGGPDLRVWWSLAFAPAPFRKQPPPQAASLPTCWLLVKGWRPRSRRAESLHLSRGSLIHVLPTLLLGGRVRGLRSEAIRARGQFAQKQLGLYRPSMPRKDSGICHWKEAPCTSLSFNAN